MAPSRLWTFVSTFRKNHPAARHARKWRTFGAAYARRSRALAALFSRRNSHARFMCLSRTTRQSGGSTRHFAASTAQRMRSLFLSSPRTRRGRFGAMNLPNAGRGQGKMRLPPPPPQGKRPRGAGRPRGEAAYLATTLNMRHPCCRFFPKRMRPQSPPRAAPPNRSSLATSFSVCPQSSAKRCETNFRPRRNWLSPPSTACFTFWDAITTRLRATTPCGNWDRCF